ncbi:hypothetical protein BDQ17DRAFT_1436538 [Cyathus striatus]|nr:hypothetical protein BDQ17DRAFT_1436538 [Cyathus striatus]
MQGSFWQQLECTAYVSCFHSDILVEKCLFKYRLMFVKRVRPDPNGKPVDIPAGASVRYSVMMMHTRKDLWGPDGQQVLFPSFPSLLPPTAIIFKFAYIQISYLLICILQSFLSFTTCPDAFPLDARPPKEWARKEGRKGKEKFKPLFALTMCSMGGMWVKAQAATDGVDGAQ